MTGIQNLKELSNLVLDVAVGIEKSLVDGKVSFSDALNFKEVLFSILPAIKDITQVDEEYFDLDESEMNELKAHIANRLELDPKNESVEKIAEMVINLIIESSALISELFKAKTPAV
jgi:hypothetical protein